MKRCNGFLCEPSLGVFTVAFFSLGLTALPQPSVAPPSSVHKSLLTDKPDILLIHHHAGLHSTVIQTLDVQTSLTVSRQFKTQLKLTPLT